MEFSQVQMLETLKTDFLGMRFKVNMTKYHLSGIAEGLETSESMSFVDWNEACDWASRVTENPNCPYVVVNMENPQTGEIEEFAA